MSVRSYLKSVFGKPLEVQLAECCEKVQGLRKMGHNEENDYAYLKILDLANALRDELLPRGIVMIPSDLEYEEKPATNSNGEPTTEVRVKTQFTVSNGHRNLIFCSYGVGRDSDGKACYIAQTGALKAFMKRLGMIFGEEDDAEKSRWTLYPREKKGVFAYQERALDAAVKNSGHSHESVEAILSEGLGQPVTLEQIAKLPPQGFDYAMKILTRVSDMTEILEASRQAAKREPQPVVSIMDAPRRDEMAGD